MKDQATGLANSQLSIQATMMETLELTKSTNARIPASREIELPCSTRYFSKAKSQKTITDFSARRVVHRRHEYPCPGADPGAPPWSYRNCDCEDRGLAQVRYRSSATIAPHSRQQLDKQYLIEADFTTWKTLFGQFRLLLSVTAQQQAWSLSFPTISFSKQNIVSGEAPIFKLAHRGDFRGIVELFRLGLASPNDRTIDGKTPLLVRLIASGLQ